MQSFIKIVICTLRLVCLVVLHPDNDTYEKVPVDFIHDSMDKLWAHRKEQLKENI